MSKKDKKGQIETSVSSIITLIIGVGVAVLVLIFVGVLGGQTYNLTEDQINSIGNTTMINDSFLAINNTAVNLTHQLIHEGSLSIQNATIEIGLGNFTVDYTLGQVTLINNATNGTWHNATYNYGDLTIQESIQNSITSGFSALEQTGTFMPVIVLAVVIAIVLGLVLGFLTFGTRGMGGNRSVL